MIAKYELPACKEIRIINKSNRIVHITSSSDKVKAVDTNTWTFWIVSNDSERLTLFYYGKKS